MCSFCFVVYDMMCCVNHSSALLDLPMAEPDVGNILLATVNNPRGPPCEEEMALYIAVVREKVLRELKYALAKREKHALAKKKGKG